MGKDLAEAFPEARDTFLAIDEALGLPLSRTMWEGPAEDLQLTHFTQPAIVAHSAAVLAVAGPKLGHVAGAAGHSLGEYSAYVSAGSLTPVDAARLVRLAGRADEPGWSAASRRDGRGAGPCLGGSRTGVPGGLDGGGSCRRGQPQRARPDGAVGRSTRGAAGR